MILVTEAMCSRLEWCPILMTASLWAVQLMARSAERLFFLLLFSIQSLHGDWKGLILRFVSFPLKLYRFLHISSSLLLTSFLSSLWIWMFNWVSWRRYSNYHVILGQVRYGTMLQDGTVSTKKLARHRGRAHKMAIEPGSPRIFYSCGEDGVVQHVSLAFFLRPFILCYTRSECSNLWFILRYHTCWKLSYSFPW